MLGALWRAYVAQLRARPLLTKGLTSFVTMGSSDAMTQRMELSETKSLRAEHKAVRSAPVNLQGLCPVNVAAVEDRTAESYDWRRTARQASTGLAYSAPVGSLWYSVLEKMVRFGGVAGVATRLCLDAFVFSPIAVAGYFCVRTALDGGRDVRDVVDNVARKLQLKWSNAVLASWSFWPAVNVFNFALVPLQFRVLYTQTLSFFWAAYLSQLNAGRVRALSFDRLHRPHLFDRPAPDVPSPAERRARTTVCVCPHCTHVLA